MANIKITKFKLCKLSNLNSITSIEIDKNSSKEGGFGFVYKSLKVDSTPNTLLAIKVFKDNGVADQSYETINNLITKIDSLNETKLPISLLCLPHFSFEGILENKKIKGYATIYLKKEYHTISDILGGVPVEQNGKLVYLNGNVKKDFSLKQSFFRQDLKSRLELAKQLVDGMNILSEVGFIHADINTDNLFINIQKNEIVIIDYDSGAITTSTQDMPTTWGKQNSWTAPEIRKQLQDGTKNIKVNIHTDKFSIIMAIFEGLLFAKSPYTFMKNLATANIESYFKSYKWPEIPKNESYCRQADFTSFIDNISVVEKEVPNLVKIFKLSFQDGYFNVNNRISYAQISLALNSYQSKFFDIQSNQITISQIKTSIPIPKPSNPPISQPTVIQPAPAKSPTKTASQPKQAIKNNSQSFFDKYILIRFAIILAIADAK